MLALLMESPHVEEFRFGDQQNRVLIGRQPGSEVFLNDPWISGKHGQVIQKQGKYYYQDLHSTNGSIIQRGEHKLRFKKEDNKMVQIQEGDRIILGNFVFKVSMQPPKTTNSAAFLKEDDDSNYSETIFYKKNLADIDRINEKLAQEKSSLRLLNKMLGAVKFVEGKEMLLNQIADTIYEALKYADNIIILQRDKEDQFVPVFSRGKKPNADKPFVSQTIINKVVREQIAIFYTDAPEEVDGSKSILDLRIKSAICVPMWNRDEITGILQVDNRNRRGAFTEDDLSITTVLGHYAAMALDNFKLYEDVLSGKEQEERIRLIFQRYVPHEVVQEVLSKREGSLLTGETKFVTALFSDIRGFTTISEKMTPEELVKILNEYFSEMIEAVQRNRGVLDKFLGDGLLAVFGAPVSYGNDALNAVLAAIEMLVRLRRFNQRQAEEEKPVFKIGIGIHTGPVVAGNIGSDKRMEYTIIGDTVNTTSRIEDLTKKLQNAILISETTYEMIKDQVEVKFLGPIELRGKTQKLNVYRVVGMKNDQTEPKFVKEIGQAKASDKAG